MAQTLPVEQLDAIVQILQRFPGGASLSDILGALQPPQPERSVYRWLDALVERQKVIRTGSHRWTRYVLAPEQGTSSTGTTAAQFPANAAAAPSTGEAASTALPDVSVQANRAPAPASPGVQPAAAAATTTAPAAGAAPEMDPDFPEMLAMALPSIVGYAMSRAFATTLLQSHAARNQKDAAGTKAYIAYVKAVLDQLTVEDAARYEIDADQYARWRKFYPAP